MNHDVQTNDSITIGRVPFAAIASAALAVMFSAVIATSGAGAMTKPAATASQQPAATQQATVSYIDQRYNADAAFRATLGSPIGTEQGAGSLRYRDYQNGRAYWTPQTGVHEVNGLVESKFLDVGAHLTAGVPTTDETQTPDGIGRYNHFRNISSNVSSSIYWTPSTGAQYIEGAIRDKWSALGWERGVLGYPTTSETVAGDGVSKYNNFQNHGTIYWSAAYGAQAVMGRIYDKWGDYQYDAGFLGKPITSETGTPDGIGRYNVFQGGSVYWSAATDAHSVGGAIRDRYAALGWEQSYLGYPTSDEYTINGGRRSDFQHGFITWNSATGQVNDYRY
jgi:uncharacterized protein with LGFP repeats